MRSNYAKYLSERCNIEIVENEDGFATYLYENDYVYIQDIYVIPDKRKQGIASLYADSIAEEAREKGYSKMLGSVNPKAAGATSSLKTLLSYGFRLSYNTNNLIYLTKEI